MGGKRPCGVAPRHSRSRRVSSNNNIRSLGHCLMPSLALLAPCASATPSCAPAICSSPGPRQPWLAS
eukprot:7891201-Lingulodinium_polyedra.AAC.1